MSYVHVWSTWQKRVVEHIRSIIFGIGDSLVSTTGAVTGVAAGSGDRAFVILSGLVVVFVESISMSAGEFLSSKSQREVDEGELAEELRQIRSDPERERQELASFYKARGFSDSEIETLVRRVMESEESILEEMAHRELLVTYPIRLAPVSNAIYMGISYLIGGLMPILFYVLLPIPWAMLTSNLGALVTLFLVGALKGRLVRVSPWRSGFEMALIALAAALVGYGVGRLSAVWLK